MPWDDPDFREAFQRRIIDADLAAEREWRSELQAHSVETGRSDAVSGVNLLKRAGAAASAIQFGYVNRALQAFEESMTLVGAEPTERDVEAFRENVAARLKQRAETLPERLREFDPRGDHAAVMRPIIEQTPINAERQLSKSLADVLIRIRTRTRKIRELERVVFVSHSTTDAALAAALKKALTEQLGEGIEIFVSSDLKSIRGGDDSKDRIVGMLKRAGVCIAIVTKRAAESRWLYWEPGFIEGRDRPVIPCFAHGAGAPPPPLGWRQARNLADAAELATLLRETADLLGIAECGNPALDEVVNEARRPAPELGLSDMAWRLCEAISRRSEHAEAVPKADRIDVTLLAEDLGIDATTLAAPIGELVSEGWIEVTPRRLGPQWTVPPYLVPTRRFFLGTEHALRGVDPTEDAHTLARHVVERHQVDGVATRVVAEEFGWSPRRINVATYHLHMIDPECLYEGASGGPIAYQFIYVKLRMQAFAARGGDRQ